MEKATITNIQIVTYSDGFKFRLIGKNKALTRFKLDKEVFGLNIEEQSESVIESVGDLEEFELFGIEFKD